MHNAYHERIQYYNLIIIENLGTQFLVLRMACPGFQALFLPCPGFMKVYRFYKNQLFYHSKPVQCALRLSHPISTTSHPPSSCPPHHPKTHIVYFTCWENKPQLIPQQTPQSPVQYRPYYREPGWLTDMIIEICSHIQSMTSQQKIQVSFLKQALTNVHKSDRMVKWCSLFSGWLEPWPSNSHKDHCSCPWKDC